MPHSKKAYALFCKVSIGWRDRKVHRAHHCESAYVKREVTAVSDCFNFVLFGGDMVTAKRARGAQGNQTEEGIIWKVWSQSWRIGMLKCALSVQAH